MFPDLMFRLRIQEKDMLLPAYLHALLSYPTKRKEIQKLASGASGSMPNISKARLKCVDLEVPPVDRQRAFVQRTSLLDQLRQKNLQSLAHLDALFASIQHRAFRGEL